MTTVKTPNWIGDPDAEGQSYIIRITRGGRLIGFLAGDLSAVLDKIADQAYAEAAGEEADDVTVWVLREAGPIPCKVKSKSHPGIGFVEHEVSWLDPYRSAREQRGNWPHETGYTRLTEH